MNSLYWILPLTVCIFYGLNGGQALQCYSCAGPRNSTNSSCAGNITRSGARAPNCTGTICSTILTNSTVSRGCVFVRTCPLGQTCYFCNSTNFCNNMTSPTYANNQPWHPVYPSNPGKPTHSKKGGADEITVSITALLVSTLLNLILPKLNL
ncbi:uncharacterized protein [Diabrotica undecimpunctata]|uniref:uncharacterized protein n=1 Tax=Diabrotica undecimpunctata TaxID=50387 RepID=UPI003B63EB79